MKKLTGIFTALITPFNEKGSVDEAGLRDNIRFQIDHGVDGIVALGTTAEATSLIPQERETIIGIVKEEIGNKVHLMVGTGGFSTEETIHQARLAHKMGADSLLAVAPYYVKPSQEGLYRHYSILASMVNSPIVIYNNPGRTGKNIDSQTIGRLAEIETIIGVKEATGDMGQINATIEFASRKNPAFSVFSGDDILSLPLLALGGDGIISVASNLVPQQVKDLYQAAEKGNFTKAREIHFQLMPFLRALALESNPIPIKTAMTLCGLPAGKCRLPLCELNEQQEKQLKSALDQTNVALGAKVY